MTYARIISLTALAMMAFAGNSLLCRQALKHTAIDPASFTAIRLVAGALMLWLDMDRLALQYPVPFLDLSHRSVYLELSLC